MIRQFSRREFLTEAGLMAGGAILPPIDLSVGEDKVVDVSPESTPEAGLRVDLRLSGIPQFTADNLDRKVIQKKIFKGKK